MTIRDLAQKLDDAIYKNHALPGFLDQEVTLQCLTIGDDQDKIPRLVLEDVHLHHLSMNRFPNLKLIVRHEAE